MSDLPPDAHALLAQKQAELDLVLALDAIRDTAGDPPAMLTAIVNLLAERFHADLCLMAVVDRDTGELELKAISDRTHDLALGAAAIRTLTARAYRAESATVWDAAASAEAGAPDIPADLRLAGIPIQMGQVRLGGVLLARRGEPFTDGEVSLMKAAESQMDSAILQGYAYYELQQRNKELEIIYRIDRIRDRHLPFDEMLNTVLHQLRDVIQAEIGFIMLYDRAGQRLELRAVTHEDLFRASPYGEQIQRVANESLERAHLICYNNLPGEVRSVMCVPLILRDEILGVFGVANPHSSRGFQDEDRRLLSAIASQMDTAIFENLEKRRLRDLLGRSVDPHVMERLLSAADVAFLNGERMVLSVLYADLRGSTRLAERTPPDTLVEFINDYLSAMVDVILARGGTLDKFVGDEVMALFGAPFPVEDHALRAVQVGLEMIEAYTPVQARWQARGVDAGHIGIGIATGELIAGEMGSALRSEYTVIGRAANLGARICAVAEGGQVLISQSTYDQTQPHVLATPIPGIEMKGLSEPVTVYHVTGLRR